MPHWLPRSALTVAASTIAKTAAPGLRTTNMTKTPGTSQTPYINACPGGNALKAGSSTAHNVFHAQNTTPKATPSTAVTTRSTVRQPLAAVPGRVGLGSCCLLMCYLPLIRRVASRARHYAEAARHEVVAAPQRVTVTPCAGITRIRFEGLRAYPALSAL